MTVYAVIPAAGRGSRLGSPLPKIFQPVTATETIWNILRNKLVGICDHIQIVISPFFKDLFEATLNEDMAAGFVSLYVQTEPLGMGDAVFCGHEKWCEAENLLIVWGDQVFVSQQTLRRALLVHAGHSLRFTLPLVETSCPYVRYFFKNNRLQKIAQQREGEHCGAAGLTDVGTFVLSVKNLWEEWKKYLEKSSCGKLTGEINFLPFLPFLSQAGWQARTIVVSDAIESRGINTPEDLLFLKKYMKQTEKS